MEISSNYEELPLEAKMETGGEDDELTISDQMNNFLTLSLLDERRNLQKAILPDADAGISLTLPLRPPVANKSRRKQLLIMDLNGLLADIVCPPPKDFKPDKTILKRAVFKRPYCIDFLKFCLERFEVGVWTSRSKKIMDVVVDFLIGDLKHKLLFCWDVSYCTTTSFYTLETKHKPLVFKDLRKVWEKNDHGLPWKKGDYNESNTLLLDDSPYKALVNPPHTSIFPHSYKYHHRNDNSLGPSGVLRVYLEELSETENIPEFVKQHPFGQQGISETSESWDFYLHVINTMSSSPIKD